MDEEHAMQPGTPGPGQDPYQQNPYHQYPPGYGQVPQYPDPFAPPPASPAQPPEYSLYSDPQAAPMPQYPMGGYSVPPMPPPPMMRSNQNNTFGLLSMIFGIVAIPLLCCFYIGAAVGVAAVVLGVIGLGKANRGEADNKGMSIAGIVCGSVAGLLGLLWLVLVVVANVAAPSYP
jgi:hypothetical protein